MTIAEAVIEIDRLNKENNLLQLKVKIAIKGIKHITVLAQEMVDGYNSSMEKV